MGEIQDGQFCQAYALVWNGTSPCEFTWSGQFDNSDGEPGPLGEDQIVNGYIDEGRGEYLTHRVVDSSTPRDTLEDFQSLNIDSSYEYNEEGEA